MKDKIPSWVWSSIGVAVIIIGQWYVNNYRIDTAVVMIVYNRYDFAKKLYNRISAVKPNKLYIIADGPKTEKKHDKEKCNRVRSIFNSIDLVFWFFRIFHLKPPRIHKWI